MSELLDSIQPYLTKWYVVISALLVSFFIAHKISVARFKATHNCAASPEYYKVNRFSLPLLYRLIQVKREGRLLDFAQKIYDDVKALTFVIKIVGVPVIITRDPENMKAVLATQFNDFALGTSHAHFKPLLGDGIFTLDGNGWKQSRSMLRPQFSREQVAHVQALEPHLQRLAKHIRLADGETINIQDLFFKLTVDTATEFLFGQSVYSLKDAAINDPPTEDFDGRSSFANSFNTAQTYLGTRAYLQMFYFIVNNSDFRKCCKQVHDFTRFYVQKGLDMTPEELEKKSENGDVFLYEVVKQTRDPKVLQDQLLNILLAGRDTTAGLLSFTFFELARHPRVFNKLKEEIYEAFGKGDDARVSEITFESLKKCEYLKWVMNEMLRLYPSVPVNFRVATKRTTLPRGGGPDGNSPIYVGKGTTVAYSVYSTHRMEEYYGKDADEFKPERWAESRKLGWAYVPFNGGPRICLGQQFALTEASYIVTRLLQMFDKLELHDDRPYPPAKSVHLTMCHQDGVYVSLS